LNRSFHNSDRAMKGNGSSLRRLQEKRRTESDNPVEPSEGSIGHQKIHPGIDPEAAAQQMASSYLVWTWQLKLDSLEP